MEMQVYYKTERVRARFIRRNDKSYSLPLSVVKLLSGQYKGEEVAFTDNEIGLDNRKKLGF